MKLLRKHGLFALAFAAVLLAAAAFRAAGLGHGLEQHLVFHPDAPKQVLRLEQYLRGQYVNHTGSRFFDGYPYGLNRVDEGLLRIWLRAADAIGSWTSGAVSPAAAPSSPSLHVSLYRRGRLLRLFYGVLATLLVFASARRWGAGRWAALAGAALYAAAPLAVTVSHAVTGDIGVDLFVAFALYVASAQAVSGRAAWWLAFGAACGAGFACKFQGALAAWMAVPPLLLGLRDGTRGWKRLLGAGLLVALGFIGATLLLNPSLALDTKQEWHDMRVNFAFIRDYGVPPERLAWPFGRKIAWGVTNNIPFVASCLGWGLVALSLAASALLSATAWRPAVASLRRRRAVPAEPSPASEEIADEETSALCSRWLLGIATFPWLAFLLATALKLEIQPFHFSFLVPPMALGVALALSWWTEPPDGAPRPLAAVAAALLVAAALAEAVHGTAREMFFWRMPETKDLAARQSAAVFGDAQWGTGRRGTSRWLKRCYPEPSVLPCFRNAESRLACPPGAWTEGQTLLPVPAVPMPADPAGDGWIFLDGPVFPRSDRMFAVPATGNGFRPLASDADGSPLMLPTLAAKGAWTERILVYPAPPRKLLVGLRTGRLPARCEVSTSLFAPAPRRMLAPESQTVLELPCPSPVYAYPADEAAGKPAVWACRLRVRSQLGPVWVTILDSPEELALYDLHGPRTAIAPPPSEDAGANEPPAPHPIAADLPFYASELALLRYLDSDTPYPLPETSASLPPPVPGAGPGLAAGPYRFHARIDCPAHATVTLLLSDRNASDAPDTLPSATFSFPAGEHDLDWAFSKPHAPYGATLRAAAGIPGCTLLSWTLKPDPEALAAAGTLPPPPAAPLLPGDASPDAIPATLLDAVYPGIATLLDLRIPDTWPASGTIPYLLSVRLDPRIPHKALDDLGIFLHLENDRGELAATLDFAFSDATFEGAPLRWKLAAPAVPPGTYTLLAGLFDGPRHAAKLRYARAAVPDPDDPKHRTLLVKTVTVLPDGPGTAVQTETRLPEPPQSP